MPDENYVLSVKNISKQIRNGGEHISILEDISFDVKKGEYIAIMGSSGSGKSTLLGILSGLDNASNGSVYLNNVNICELNDDELTDFRNKNIGIVFQNPNLIPVLSAKENIELPLYFSKKRNLDKKIEELLDYVGLRNKKDLMPKQLSGGEQQRIAVIRSLIQEPAIIFADEPTGALDSQNGEKVIELFEYFRQKHSMAIVLVTHDEKVASKADKILIINDGRIKGEC